MSSLQASLPDSDDPLDLVRAIKRYAQSKEFAGYAEATAAQLVTHLFTDAGRTWRQAARRNSQGRGLYESLQHELMGPLGGAIRHEIERNAAIIRTLPADVARQVTGHLATQTMMGTRASDIAEQIKQYFPHASEAKANLIARTETSKTSTALTRARSQLAGVDWYIWRTSEDSRVRDSHKRMDIVLVKWSDPPDPEQLDGEERSFGHYHAGDIFNCRCYPEPVIDLDLINWPAKVYRAGAIQRMTKSQFKQVM